MNLQRAAHLAKIQVEFHCVCVNLQRAPHPALIKSNSPLLILAWGMRNADASSHRLRCNRPALRIKSGDLILNRQDDATLLQIHAALTATKPAIDQGCNTGSVDACGRALQLQSLCQIVQRLLLPPPRALAFWLPLEFSVLRCKPWTYPG